MNERQEWIRIAGGGCFINLALTGLLVGLFAAVSSFGIDTIVLPFMIGATASFGASLYLLRQSPARMPMMRKVILAGAGVLLGSICTVLGIAGLIYLGV